MTKYLLDTDIIEFLGNTHSPYNKRCIEHLEALSEEDELCVSILSQYELEYGIVCASFELQPRLRQLSQIILAFASILPLTEQGSQIYGHLKHLFKKSSDTKPRVMKTYTVDMIIAATALEQNATLVSSDALYIRLCELEPSLQRENWAAEAI